MKKTVLFFLTTIFMNCLAVQAQFHSVPQLQAGVFVYDTIAFHGYGFAGYCDSLGTSDITFSMNTDLAPIASGVELKYIVSGLPLPPDTAYCVQTGVLHIGDTLPFPSANSYYTVYSTSYAGGIGLTLIITGTPTVPFESYPCSVYSVITNADCANVLTTMGFGTPCTVNNFVGINESNGEENFTIEPNPVSETFEIKFTSVLKRESTFNLYNVQGRIIENEILPPGFKSKCFHVNKHSNGFYFWKITDPFGFEQAGKLLINKTE